MLVDPAFLDHVATEVPAGTNLTYKLHPPALRALGRKKKIGLGPKSRVALKLLAKGKKLRGTKLDPFGYAHVRKVERQLLADYTDLLNRIVDHLDGDNYDAAAAVAALPDMVRGYEGVKMRNVELYRDKLRELDQFGSVRGSTPSGSHDPRDLGHGLTREGQRRC